MAYLIAKIFFLLILSALGGALLMYWWVRRRYEDVTISFSEVQAEKKSLKNEIDTLRQSLAIKKDLQHSLATIESAIKSLPSSFENNLAPVLGAISNISIPEAKNTDLSPVLNAIHQIRIPEPTETDLTPVLRVISNIRIPETKETDLSQVMDAIHQIRIPETANADLSPLIERIDQLEQKLDARVDTSNNTQQFVVEGSANLLTHAAYGNPDDLKTIKGVGTKLEAMLHEIGVYYFWQVAEWRPEDIQEVDALLDSFKGRIQRDDWVNQAKELTETATAKGGIFS